MDRVRKILAFVDPRPESIMTLEHSVALARRTGASVTVMDVVEGERWPMHEELYGISLDARRNLLEDLAGRFRQERVGVDVKVVSGRPSVELIHAVLADEHDLVIKTAKGRRDGRSSLFGTTAMHLIRKCPCPVWLLGPEALPPRPKILAAVDPGFEDDEVSAALARKVIAKALTLAQHLDGEVHVVHAWHLPSEHLLARHMSMRELREMLNLERRSTQRQLLSVMDAAGGLVPPERTHLLKGMPEEVIPSVAHEQGIDAIVMGSVGRSGIAGLLIGEMAEEILGRVECGVLCVKPDGFVSPLKPRK